MVKLLIRLALCLALALLTLGAAQGHNGNHPPVVKAVVDYCTNARVQVQAQAADPNNDDLTVAWRVAQEAGPQWTLEGQNTLSPVFCTREYGEFVLEVTVSDGFAMVTDTVTVTVE